MSEPGSEQTQDGVTVDLDFGRFWELRALAASRVASFASTTRAAAGALGARSASIAFLSRESDSLERRYGVDLHPEPLGVDLPDRPYADDLHLDEPDLFAVDAPQVPASALGAVDEVFEVARLIGAPLRDGNGWPLGALCLFFDAPRELSGRETRILCDLAATLSERLEAKRVMLRALRSERRLMDAVEAAADAFVFYDADDRLVFCNRSYREIYAESAPAMFPGARFEDILRYGLANGQYPEAKGREEAWLVERLAHHGAPRGPIVQPIPGDRWLLIEERRTADGGVVGFRVDVTELKRHQQALEQAKAELQDRRDNLERAVKQRTAMIGAQARELALALEQERRLNNLQRSFVAMASHEFRTPLAIIDGALQRLRRRAGSIETPDLLRYYDKIGASVKRMLALIESTLSAARLEAGSLEVSLKPCDIGEVLRSCCDRQREISPTFDIALSVRDVPEEIPGDPSALEQVFANLLSNAVKYSGDSARIEVSARPEDAWIAISIHDFGLGMDMDDLDRLGERYFRAKTSVGVAGTGIGLNLVKAILEAHGGRLSVDSRLGEGSTFTVRLPKVGEGRSLGASAAVLAAPAREA